MQQALDRRSPAHLAGGGAEIRRLNIKADQQGLSAATRCGVIGQQGQGIHLSAALAAQIPGSIG
jgi:hypothetical protein